MAVTEGMAESAWPKATTGTPASATATVPVDIPVERAVGFLAIEVFSFDIELTTAVEMTPGTWLVDVVTVSMAVDRFDVRAAVFSVSFEVMVVD